MSVATSKPGQNAASRQGRKKMRILVVLGAITLFTWSKQLLGSEDNEKSAAAGVNTAAGTKEKPGAGAVKGPRAAKAILTFEQAMERMTQWPEALHRRVIDGPIEDLTPSNWSLDPAPRLTDGDDEPESGNAGSQVEDPSQTPATGAQSEEHSDGSSLGITLRSTVIFGSKRYAVLNGVRYAEGETVVAGDGAGRYLLVSVRSREVTLSSGGRTWILVIRDQSAPDKKPDQAE